MQTCCCKHRLTVHGQLYRGYLVTVRSSYTPSRIANAINLSLPALGPLVVLARVGLKLMRQGFDTEILMSFFRSWFDSRFLKY